jgi:hypothetical protein
MTLPHAFCWLGALALASAIVGASESALSETSKQPKGCPLEIAIRQVDDFVRGQMADYAAKSEPILQEMEAIGNKASKPGISIGDQLSAKDRDRYNQLRHANIELGAERLRMSDFQRDVHVIEETYKVAELADLYEAHIESLGDADPRRFYFTILQGLRIAQPRTPRTPLISVGIECDPEAGLYFQEEFYQQQLAQSGADQRLVDLAFDIERLRTMYQLSWNVFNKGISDLRATTWSGDTRGTPDSIAPMIATSSAATQNVYRAIFPYIDKQFPSEMTFENRFMQKQVQQAARDYPVQKK